MPHRKPELRQLIDGLALGLDALVRSHWGSETSSFAGAVVRELERRGYEVIHVVGTTRRAATQFGALRFSIEDLFRGSSDPITVVDRLSSRIREALRPVLVIENADLVDPLSLEVIHDAVERTGCRQVILLSEVPASDTSPLVRPPVQVITLAPPPYSAIESLVRESVNTPVSDAWIRRAYIDSGGSPDIVSAILADASVARGAAARDTASVLAVVGSRLAELPSTVFECLRGIALHEPLPLREGVSRFGTAALESLERAGLVSLTRAEDGMVLSCPPLITAYFTTAGGSIVSLDDNSSPSISIDRPDSVHQLVRELDERSRDRLARARHAHAVSPSAATRVELADALWLVDADSDEIEPLLFGSPVSGELTGSSDQHARAEIDLALTCAHFLAARGRLAEARTVLDTISGVPDELAGLVAAETLLITIQYDAIPAEATARLIEDVSTHTASVAARTAAALCLVYAGRLDEAMRVLPDAMPETPRERTRWQLITGVNALTRSGLRAADVFLASTLADAIDERDGDRIQALGYVTVIVRLLHGQWSSASALLSGLRALGHASMSFWPLYRALRGMHAIVLAAEGKESAARTLAKETHAMSGFGPLTASHEHLDSLVDAFLRRDPGSLADGFAHLANTAQRRGFMLAHECYLAVALALGKRDALDPATTSAPAVWTGWSHFASLITALWASDAATVADLMRSNGDDAFPFLTYLALNHTLAELNGADLAPDAADLIEFLTTTLGASSSGLGGRAGRTGEVISDREREVALLAATLSNAEIARRLGVSKRTIDHHISNALRKTGARTRLELNAYVREASPQA